MVVSRTSMARSAVSRLIESGSASSPCRSGRSMIMDAATR
jgi:hypothetical protein